MSRLMRLSSNVIHLYCECEASASMISQRGIIDTRQRSPLSATRYAYNSLRQTITMIVDVVVSDVVAYIII